MIYKCYYKGRQVEVQAETSYKAQQAAAAAFKASEHEVHVALAASNDNQRVG